MTRTHLQGLAAFDHLPDNACFRARRKALETRARELRQLVPVMARYAHNDTERALVTDLQDSFARVLGPMSPRERAVSVVALALAARFALRVRLVGDRFQPPTHRELYRHGRLHQATKVVSQWADAFWQRRLALTLPARTHS
jgi:hypothetical protein